MKAKPFFKEVVRYADYHQGHLVLYANDAPKGQRLRITDDRRPSALRVAERILQRTLSLLLGKMHHADAALVVDELAKQADMTATIRDGRVKCDWREK